MTRRSAETEAAAGALSGVRVVDFTQVLSGPYCTQILADLNAEVIKIESPRGDVARSMPPHFVDEDSVYYLSINRNKQSIVLDLKHEEGVRVAKRLIAGADVVVENFRPGVLTGLGIEREALMAEKPALIWCSISGFGQFGPYRDRQAYDLVIQALSGGMSLTGEPDGPAVRAGIPIADISAGIYGVIGILAALVRVKDTGVGEYIDVSMLDCQAAMLCYQAAYSLNGGTVPGRQGRGHDSIAAYGAFRARDGVELVVAAMTDEMWEGLCRTGGRADLIKDPRFKSKERRRANKAELWAILDEVFLEDDADDWVVKLEAAGVPAGTVNTLDRVAADPQLAARGMMIELQADDGRHLRVIGNPLLMEHAGRLENTYPPRAGENSEEILSAVLDMSDEEIGRLIEEGVVRPPHKTQHLSQDK